MTKIPEYVRGYRDAFKDVITLVHMQADRMGDERAKPVVNLLADHLSTAAEDLTRRVMFLRLREYVREHGEFAPNLPQEVAEAYENIRRAEEERRVLQQKLKESDDLWHLEKKGAHLRKQDKKNG